LPAAGTTGPDIFGLTPSVTKGHLQSRGQGVEILVDGPQQRVWGEKDRGKQGHIHRPAAQALKLLSLDQFKRFFARRNNGLPQSLEIAERTFTRDRGRPTGEFQYYQRMAQHLVRRQQ
jgi:hypothetical protein